MALSGQRLPNFLHLLLIWLRQSLKQPIRADSKRLTDFGKGRDQKWKFAVFNIAYRLPVDAHEFGKAFLGKIGFEAGRFHVLADEPEHLTICHPLFETMFARLLTSNILDANEPRRKRSATQPTVMLTKCPECLKEVSDSATCCPFCGFTPPVSSGGGLCDPFYPCWPKLTSTAPDVSRGTRRKKQSGNNKVGWFLIFFIIAGFGSDLLACGIITAVAWNVFDYNKIAPYEWWWLHVLCFGFGALVAAGSVASAKKFKK